MSTGRTASILPFPSPRDSRITVPDAPEEDVQITFRIDLAEVQPRVWRRLEVAGDVTLDALSEVLEAAMGWAGGHLHQFWPERAWTGPRFLTSWDIEEEGEEGTAEADVRLDQVLRAPGDTLRWSYDFGDGWEHVLKAETIRPAAPDALPARCVDGRNACPLEDCGGPGGHAEIVQLLRSDPHRRGWPEHLVDWVPDDYDPTEFDPDNVNAALALLGASPEELLSAFQEAVQESVPDAGELTEPVRTFLLELPTAASGPLTALAALSAGQSQAVPGIEAAVAPWMLLLRLAGTDGIPLTGAGWMKPAIVEQIAGEFGLLGTWMGKGNRENQAMPIADLRASAVTSGLLRNHRGRLLVTTLGASVRTDPDRVLTAVARGLLRGRLQPAERVARTVYLMHLAAGIDRDDSLETTAGIMSMLGWASGGGTGVSTSAVHGLTAGIGSVLAWVEGEPLSWTTPQGPLTALVATRAVWIHR